MTDIANVQIYTMPQISFEWNVSFIEEWFQEYLKLYEDRVFVISEIKDNTDAQDCTKSSNKYAIREMSTVD